MNHFKPCVKDVFQKEDNTNIPPEAMKVEKWPVYFPSSSFHLAKRDISCQQTTVER